MTRRPVVVLGLLLPLGGCTDGGTACPAVHLDAPSHVLVQLDGGWPPGVADTVLLRCDPSCGEGDDQAAEVLADETAWFDAPAEPDSVVVTVVDVHGVELTGLSAQLDFGDAHGPGCGGPQRATVAVPAP